MNTNTTNDITSNQYIQQYHEVSIPVPWGEVRGKWWGSTKIRPILTIHGWQDSCGSFNRLIPLLDSSYSFLTIDLPGHGFSSRLPSGMYYFVMNYVITIKHIVNYFQWEKVSLFGHSLGGIISLIYSMFYHNTIDVLICCDIDIIINEMVIISRKKYPQEIEKYLKLSRQSDDDKNEPPSYTLEEIKQRVSHGAGKQWINYEYAHHIFERNIAPSKTSPGKYYFSRDPRVKSDSGIPFHPEDLRSYALKVTFSLLDIRAQETTSKYEDIFSGFLEIVKMNNKNFKHVIVEGNHHVHLNNPDKLSSIINAFVRKYYTKAEMFNVKNTLPVKIISKM